MNKKLYIKVMASAALLSAIALPAQAATDLTDINGSYAKEAIQELVNAGILNGKGDGKFDPSGKIERQDFAIILAKALGLELDQVPASTTFTDVPTSHYAYKYVEAAAKAGLITGYGNGVFGTGNSLSRQDMAVIFVRALGVDSTGKGADLEFSDAGQIADYAKDAVGAAVELGLIAGAGNGQFNPTGTAERQAVALVASNFLKKSEEIKKQNEGGNPASPGDTPAPTQPDKPTTPTTPTTPSTPSTPSSGGSSGGGSSSPQPDTTAPTVTLVSSSPVTSGGTVVARSNESGALYLIAASFTPRTKSELDSLSSGRGVIATSANINANIPTTGLPAGTYRVYAVDAAGNVSEPSATLDLLKSLQDFVTEAQTLVNTATGGAEPGNYPGISIEDLRQAIMAAQSVLNNPTSTPTDFNNAAAALREAISIFKSTQVPFELELQLTEGAKLALNSGLASGAEVTLTDSDTGIYQYQLRNIHNFVQVTRNHVVQRLEYHPDTYVFSVFDPETEVEVATLKLDNASPLVEIEPSPTGVVIRPLEALEENDEVALTFNLLNLDVLIASKDLMIKADQTPPTVTAATYNAEGSITLTFSEELPSEAFPSSPTLLYSPSGDFTDSLNPVGYTVSKLSSTQMRIQFNPETIAELDFKSPGKFRIMALNGTDYANLPLNLNLGKTEIDIP